jgi:hypothetical protein
MIGGAVVGSEGIIDTVVGYLGGWEYGSIVFFGGIPLSVGIRTRRVFST